MQFVRDIITSLYDRLEQGGAVALVTLVKIDGSSPRPLGAQAGVCDDGQVFGMITGGCAEKAIVEEAMRLIKAQKNKLVRYGAGSPYIDIVLPCGSGIELFIETRNSAEIIRKAHAAMRERAISAMIIDLDALTSVFSREVNLSPNDRRFVKVIKPSYRIYAFGEGTNLASFCLLAHTAGFSVKAFSPDETALAFLGRRGISGRQICQRSDYSVIPLDPFTAIVTLFHEHDWETGILEAALNSDADYIGALGSKRTHEARLDQLASRPSTKYPAELIRGPVGLDIGAEDPNEVAISILAEIVYLRRGRG